MGVIGKLAFWRKSSKKADAVEAFVTTVQEPVEKSPKGEATKVPAFAQQSEDMIPQDAPVEASFEKPSYPTMGASSSSSSQSHTPNAGVSPKRSLVVASHCSDADELEAELCDEVLCPLPEPKTAPEEIPLNNFQDELTFNKSVDDIFAGVSQAFGPMIASSLQSPKWDKRAQALKAVGTMLRGLDLQGMAPPGSTGVLGKGLRLQERAVCWRICCQLLHHVMHDKVMPVRLASHELFQEAFGNAEGLVEQEECHIALGVLLQHVFDRLGDSNLRLHESARKCVFYCAERPFLLGLDVTLARLRERLDAAGKGKAGDRQKVYNGVLDTVNFLVQHFPGRRVSSRNLNDDDDDEEIDDSATSPAASWIAADIAPFIVPGMDDSLGPRVRSTVIALAVTVYQTFGMEAMQPMLEGLRPAKQALLRQKFQESEDGEPEDYQRIPHCDRTSSTMATPSDGLEVNDLMVCGNSVKLAGAHPLLPGSMGDPDEEDLMDGILEETGLVFNGACIVNEGGFGHDERCLRPVPGLARTLLEDDLEEEHRILEEELMKLDGTELDVQEVC